MRHTDVLLHSSSFFVFFLIVVRIPRIFNECHLSQLCYGDRRTAIIKPQNKLVKKSVQYFLFMQDDKEEYKKWPKEKVETVLEAVYAEQTIYDK